MHNIIKLIRDRVIPKTKPAVYLSGGFDSSTILHHLAEKTKEVIYTYTAKFKSNMDECKKAEKIASKYNTIHKNIEIKNIVKSFPEIMKFFDAPRYNIWPYWLAKQAKIDGRQNIYIGEGSDEYFGGYDFNKGYLLAWAGQINFVRFTYDQIHKFLELNLEVPFSDIYWKDVAEYYEPTYKMRLRHVYKGILPNEVINIDASQPPAFTDKYWDIWNSELKYIYPHYNPSSIEDIKRALQFHVTKIWVEVHGLK